MPETHQPTPPPCRERYTEADFENLSWHDNFIHAIAIQGKQQDELALDIDFVVGCSCNDVCGPGYWLAPATLVFQNVTDLRMHLDWPDSGFQCAIHCASIHQVVRERVLNQKICLDRPYHSWRIEINWPDNNCIEFGATGFTQTLRTKPILWDWDLVPESQRPFWLSDGLLPSSQRPPFA